MGGLQIVDGVAHFEGVPVYDAPLLQVAYGLDPRDPARCGKSWSEGGQADTWHGVSLSAQLRSLYEISNNGATVSKTERDLYVDAVRTSTPLRSGVHRFRVRILKKSMPSYIYSTRTLWTDFGE